MFEFDAFFTHTWVADNLKRDNHQRVLKIYKGLKERGIKGWIDEERMTGSIPEQMSGGIESSQSVLVFVTEAYINKVNGEGEKGQGDNCLLEFNHAAAHKVGKIITILMEKVNQPWKGPVGLYLGNRLYIDCSGDITESKIDEIYREILKYIIPIR